jgi:hypothetical protein
MSKPKTIIGETAKEMTGDGRKTNYPKHMRDKHGTKKSKK